MFTKLLFCSTLNNFLGGDAYLQEMNQVRDLQEKLSKLHFELEEEDLGQR